MKGDLYLHIETVNWEYQDYHMSGGIEEHEIITEIEGTESHRQFRVHSQKGISIPRESFDSRDRYYHVWKSEPKRTLTTLVVPLTSKGE